MLSPDANPVPLTVSVRSGLPVSTLAGEILVSVRSGGIVRTSGADGAPPGFTAVIFTGPGVCVRLEGTERDWNGVNVPRLVPFQETVTPGSKPEPLTLR